MYQTSLDFNLDDATDYAAPNAQSATFPTTRPDPEKTLTRLLTPTEADTVRASEAWGPLMAAFGEAEVRTLDLDRAVPSLVQGRTISSADDIAALLHGRVTKWLKAAGGLRQPDRIVGHFPPAIGVTDPDMVQALQDRRGLIEQRARALTLAALEQRQTWTLKLGRPPSDPVHREDWLRRLDTVAAYRQRWQVNAGAVLGEEPRSHEQTAHQQSAQHAASTLLAIAHTPDLARDTGITATVVEPGNR